MAAYLTEIVAAHRAQAATDDRDVNALVERALTARQPRPFADALRDAAARGLAVIAEIKRRSPSRGDLAVGLDPATVARQYTAGGAACVSVLTDGGYFGGSREDLEMARAATGVPVLRKDFTVSEADVCDARLMGADAVLLIVAALSDEELARFSALATQLGLAALVEVHDEAELDRALAVAPTLIGVNQRDLSTFEVDRDHAARLAARIPGEALAVAESGIRDPADASRLAESGFDAVLVGEMLVQAQDPSAAVAGLRGHRITPRSTSRERGTAVSS